MEFVFELQGLGLGGLLQVVQGQGKQLTKDQPEKASHSLR